MNDEAAGFEAAGLYVHVPFCSAICPYCDFAVTLGDEEAHARYEEALLSEIALHAGDPIPNDTVYFGGGTPSALAPERLGRILQALRESFTLTEDGRVFLEANPEDVDEAALDAWRALGVKFLSLGVQSFDDAELRFLGRRHDAATARRSVAVATRRIEAARKAGFETVSVDLIFGLPDQSSAAWIANLDAVAELAPDHVSCYQLTVKANTPFDRRREAGGLVEMDETSQGGFFAATHERLAAAGLAAYEVSNFARSPEHRSRHNMKYWTHVPYIGLGPSAHSFDGRRRWWNHRDLDTWADALASGRSGVEDEEVLEPKELALEEVMLRMRTTEGICLQDFRERYRIDLLVNNILRIDGWVNEGLVATGDGWLRPTTKGLAVADGLAAALDVTP